MAGLLFLLAWVAFPIVMYLLFEFWVFLTHLSYSSPKNYLLYSVIPLLALSLIFGVGRVLWEIWEEDLSGWWHRRRDRRKLRADGRRESGDGEPDG